MVLEHESISHNIDAHFFQILISQERCELTRNFVLLEGIEIVSEAPLSKIRPELAGVPVAIIGQVVEIHIVFRH